MRPMHPNHPLVWLEGIDLVGNCETMRLVEHRNEVPYLEVLVFVDDAFSARLARVVNEGVRIEPTSAVAELRDPRPHLLRRRTDADRPCRVELCSADDVVAGHRSGRLGVRSSAAHVPRPYQGSA